MMNEEEKYRKMCDQKKHWELARIEDRKVVHQLWFLFFVICGLLGILYIILNL